MKRDTGIRCRKWRKIAHRTNFHGIVHFLTKSFEILASPLGCNLVSASGWAYRGLVPVWDQQHPFLFKPVIHQRLNCIIGSQKKLKCPPPLDIVFFSKKKENKVREMKKKILFLKGPIMWPLLSPAICHPLPFSFNFIHTATHFVTGFEDPNQCQWSLVSFIFLKLCIFFLLWTSSCFPRTPRQPQVMW